MEGCLETIFSALSLFWASQELHGRLGTVYYTLRFGEVTPEILIAQSAIKGSPPKPGVRFQRHPLV